MNLIYQFLISVIFLSMANEPHTNNGPDQNAVMIGNNSSTSDLAAPKVRRGCNYTSDEDDAIARAHVYVRSDAIVGSDQNGTHKYLRIYEAYKKRKQNDVPFRSAESVTTRLKATLKESLRFPVQFCAIKSMKKSIISRDNEIGMATAIVNKK